jgi:tetratricopeptide (TPR) repeat protein
MKVLFLLLCFLTISAFADPEENAVLFHRGNEQYLRGEFEEALVSFQKIEGTSPEVAYNIGNTLMRLGRSDEAMAHYRRAQWMAPGDPDVKANLSKASENLSISVPELPVWRRLTGWWGAGTWQTVFLISCWLTAGAGLCFSVVTGLREHRIWILPPLCVSLMFSGFGVWSSLPSHFTQEAVVRQTDAITRFEPLPDATEKARIPAGTVVTVLESQRDWIRIQSNDLTGWIGKEDLVRL